MYQQSNVTVEVNIKLPVINITHGPMRRSNTLASKVIKSLQGVGRSVSSLFLVYSYLDFYTLHITRIINISNAQVRKKQYQSKCTSTWVITHNLHLCEMFQLVYFCRLKKAEHELSCLYYANN